MENIKLNINGKEKEIRLVNPTGKEVKEGYNLFVEIEKTEQMKERIKAVDNYYEFVENLALSRNELTIEQLDEQDIDIKTAILKYYSDKIANKIGFLMP